MNVWDVLISLDNRSTRSLRSFRFLIWHDERNLHFHSSSYDSDPSLNISKCSIVWIGDSMTSLRFYQLYFFLAGNGWRCVIHPHSIQSSNPHVCSEITISFLKILRTHLKKKGRYRHLRFVTKNSLLPLTNLYPVRKKKSSQVLTSLSQGRSCSKWCWETFFFRLNFS